MYVESKYAMKVLFGFAIHMGLITPDFFVIKEIWGIPRTLDFDEIETNIDRKKDLAKCTIFTSAKNFVTNEDYWCNKNASNLSNAISRLDQNFGLP